MKRNDSNNEMELICAVSSTLGILLHSWVFDVVAGAGGCFFYVMMIYNISCTILANK